MRCHQTTAEQAIETGQRGGEGVLTQLCTPFADQIRSPVERAAKLGRSLGLEMKLFPFTPQEQAVCAQEPHRTLFVRYDGMVSACISLARGGPTTFFGEDAVMPTVEFGRLPEEDLLAIWEGDACRTYRDSFEGRIQAYQSVFMEGLSSKSPAALEKTTARARDAMPVACPGCRTCHYLYGV